jgi:hypothetical protein
MLRAFAIFILAGVVSCKARDATPPVPPTPAPPAPAVAAPAPAAVAPALPPIADAGAPAAPTAASPTPARRFDPFDGPLTKDQEDRLRAHVGDLEKGCSLKMSADAKEAGSGNVVVAVVTRCPIERVDPCAGSGDEPCKPPWIPTWGFDANWGWYQAGTGVDDADGRDAYVVSPDAIVRLEPLGATEDFPKTLTTTAGEVLELSEWFPMASVAGDPVGSGLRKLASPPAHRDWKTERLFVLERNGKQALYKAPRTFIEERTMGVEPLIYLYSHVELDVSIRIGDGATVTTSWPSYREGWNVRALASGRVIDRATGTEHGSLFWEGASDLEGTAIDEGFVLARDDVEAFLDEKLAALGLNAREARDFAEFWRPVLESTPYVLVRFLPENEIEARYPLEIEPRPDTLLRVHLDSVPLDAPIHVPPQTLEVPPARHGFVVVEWSGELRPSALAYFEARRERRAR